MSKKNTKGEVKEVKEVKKHRKTIEEKIAALERKLSLLKNKPEKALVKEACKIVKRMTKSEIEEFLNSHK